MKPIFPFFSIFFAFLSFLAFLAFLAGCCVRQPSHTTQDTDRYQMIHHLQDSTVALQKQTELGDYRTHCTGVWIAKDRFLTAKHCVMDMEAEQAASAPGKIVKFKNLQEINDRGEQHPPKADYSQPHLGVVLAVDEDNDLALVSAMDWVTHSIAPIRRTYVYTGTPVHIIGHTAGLNYTYLSGIVSAVRKLELSDDKLHRVFQISSPAYFGNSGGGAFDMDGNLIGICSLLLARGPNVVFFIHTDVILNFLRAEHEI